MNYFEQYKGLPREVYLIFFARMINSLGSFIFPFLTLYLSQKIGMHETEIGRYLLLTSVVSIPAVIISGKLVDLFSRKWVYVIAQSISALLLASVGFMGTSPIIPLVLITAVFFMSFAWPALSAMMMDYTTSENRQAAFSLGYLGMNVGFAFGPMIAGLLFVNATQWIFWGDAATTLAAVVMVIMVYKDKPAEERVVEKTLSEKEQAHKGSTLSALTKRPALIVFSVLMAILSWVYAQNFYALPLHMTDIFGARGPQLFGYNGSINGLVVVLFTPLILLATKRFKPVVNMIVVGILYMIGFGFYGVTQNIWLFFFATVIWTFGEIIGAVNISVYIANHSPVTHRGRFQSIFDIIHGTGRATGPWLAGMYLLSHNLNQLWFLTAGVALFGTVLLFALYVFEFLRDKRKSRLMSQP